LTQQRSSGRVKAGVNSARDWLSSTSSSMSWLGRTNVPTSVTSSMR